MSKTFSFCGLFKHTNVLRIDLIKNFKKGIIEHNKNHFFGMGKFATLKFTIPLSQIILL